MCKCLPGGGQRADRWVHGCACVRATHTRTRSRLRPCMLQLKLISLLCPLHALPTYLTSQLPRPVNVPQCSSDCTDPLMWTLHTQARTAKTTKVVYMKKGGGGGAGEGHSHFPAACEGSPNLMMCGQWSRALLKNGLVTPSIIAGLSSR